MQFLIPVFSFQAAFTPCLNHVVPLVINVLFESIALWHLCVLVCVYSRDHMAVLKIKPGLSLIYLSEQQPWADTSNLNAWLS